MYSPPGDRPAAETHATSSQSGFKVQGSGDGRADEKMADEICGSLKLMRGEEQTERGEREGGEEGKFIVSVFAVANKRKRLHFAEPVYSFCQREREREQGGRIVRRTGIMERREERESETARLLLFGVTSAADVVPALAA